MMEISRFEKYRGKPAVFVTADTDTATRIAALDAGAIDFLTKPINQLEFLARLKNLTALVDAQNKLADKAAWLRSVVDEAIALAYGLPSALCADMRLASPMHDIGKVAIPDAVLLKKGSLTEEKFSEMQRHTVVGRDILREPKSSLLQLAAEIASSHHERWDGQGYPFRLAGNAIPLAGRIVAVADNFDVLTTARPYKQAWSIERAVEHIIGRAGTQSDPQCAEAFHSRDQAGEYRCSARSGFGPKPKGRDRVCSLKGP